MQDNQKIIIQRKRRRDETTPRQDKTSRSQVNTTQQKIGDKTRQRKRIQLNTSQDKIANKTTQDRTIKDGITRPDNHKTRQTKQGKARQDNRGKRRQNTRVGKIQEKAKWDTMRQDMTIKHITEHQGTTTQDSTRVHHAVHHSPTRHNHETARTTSI